jgi:hypothetical protein
MWTAARSSPATPVEVRPALRLVREAGDDRSVIDDRLTWDTIQVSTIHSPYDFPYLHQRSNVESEIPS